MNTAEGRTRPCKGSRAALIAAVAFAVTYIAALMTSGAALPVAAKAGISLAATAAFIWFVRAELELIRRLDELQQRIQLEALAFAFPASVGLLMLIGLFQRFLTLPVEDLSYRHLWPVMVFTYFLGLALARAKYQ
jgi:hypothetical protein